MNGELRALNPGNQKRKWNDCGTSSKSMAQKKLVVGPAKSRAVNSTKPCSNVTGQTILQLSAV